MFNDKEILKIFDEAFKEFNKKHKITCSVEIVDYDKFWEIAKESKLVAEQLKNGIPVIVGALVRHRKDEDIVYLSADVLNQITDDKKFVKAIIMHEFYHILLKDKLKEDSVKEDEKSEERAKEKMREEFPDLAEYLD